jgi:hypothetical protein
MSVTTLMEAEVAQCCTPVTSKARMKVPEASSSCAMTKAAKSGPPKEGLGIFTLPVTPSCPVGPMVTGVMTPVAVDMMASPAPT